MLVRVAVAEEPTTLPSTLPNDLAPIQPPAATTRGASFNEEYGVLRDRNMFLQNRPRPRPTFSEPPPSTREAAPLAPERNFVLRGVVLEDADLRAYVEDAAAGRIVRLAPGDALARGHVTEIEVDAVHFERDGASIWIEVGQDFSGTRVAALPPPPPTLQPSAPATRPSIGANGATPTGGAAAAQPAGGGPNPATIERMRQRGLRNNSTGR
jgi:hypothetical protein